MLLGQSQRGDRDAPVIASLDVLRALGADLSAIKPMEEATLLVWPGSSTCRAASSMLISSSAITAPVTGRLFKSS